MPARKRPPSETLLPLRAAKHPRLAEPHANERQTFADNVDGASYLVQVGMKILKLGYEKTIRSLFPAQDAADDTTLPQPHPIDPAEAPPPPSPPPPRHPSRPAIPSEFKTELRPQNRQSSSQPSSSLTLPRRPSHRVPKVPPIGVELPLAGSSSGSSQPAVPPRARRKSEPNVKAFPLQPPVINGIDTRAQASAEPRSSAGPKYLSGRKKYVAREHIFAKQHKARVKETREKDLEEMEQALFERKRQGGFTGDYASFKGYLRYKARLEKLQSPLAALSPSASLTDLRRPIEEEPLTKDFLQRAWDKVDASLKSPPAAKLDAPTLEKILATQRERDEDIERRLRAPRLPTSLPPEDDAIVDDLLSMRGVISKCGALQIEHKDMARLAPDKWLNDEIVNFYGQLMMNRAEVIKKKAGTNGKKKPLEIYYFNTFFWQKISKQTYEESRLDRWTKKFDIFAKDIVLIPINHNNTHWTAAAINFRRKRIESYDSMGMPRRAVFERLKYWLDKEHRKKKKGAPFDFTGWEDYVLKDTPQQENGYDCGVFTCQFLETLSRGEERFSFTQSNIPYLRRRMIWEIGNAKLRDDP